jgi:NADH-quinone oxidoreductase subunit E
MLELFEKLRSVLQTPFGYQLFGSAGSLLGAERVRRALLEVMMENNIEQILARYPKGDRGFLIPILQEVQESYGYISPDVVDEIGRFTRVNPGEIFGVASFYSQFRFTEPGKHTIKVCLGTACHVRGGSRILDWMEHKLHVKAGETTPDGQFSLEQVACFGCCALAPVVVVDSDVHARMNSTKGQKLLKKYES